MTGRVPLIDILKTVTPVGPTTRIANTVCGKLSHNYLSMLKWHHSLLDLRDSRRPWTVLPLWSPRLRYCDHRLLESYFTHQRQPRVRSLVPHNNTIITLPCLLQDPVPLIQEFLQASNPALGSNSTPSVILKHQPISIRKVSCRHKWTLLDRTPQPLLSSFVGLTEKQTLC